MFPIWLYSEYIEPLGCILRLHVGDNDTVSYLTDTILYEKFKPKFTSDNLYTEHLQIFHLESGLPVEPEKTLKERKRQVEGQLVPAKLTSEKVLDDRPVPDEDIAPVELLYDGFGLFTDIFNGKDNIPGLSEVDRAGVRAAVDDFAAKMCLAYEKEDDCRDEGPPLTAFSQRAQASRFLLHKRLPHRRMATISANMAWLQRLSSAKTSLWETLYPKLSSMENALSRSDHRWYEASGMFYVLNLILRANQGIALRSMLSLLLVISVDLCLSLPPYRVLKLLLAARIARPSTLPSLLLLSYKLVDIDKFLASSPPKIPPNAHRYPAISRLREYPTGSDGYLSFQILQFYPDRQSYPQFYIAETSDKRRILVKFVKCYSLDLHALCARHGHAPEILAFEALVVGRL
ncbi:unnamed protein product [Cyclocybe aegerita]|uniref:Uncharacterized protein n=1 Tax=Cyclocybe aegerita TaxID=1973307 RepID=A0A8S0W377_CYCAE|nr:unnamed protein product [Cyclocybe aegerita]